jgi:hypothetical protein
MSEYHIRYILVAKSFLVSSSRNVVATVMNYVCVEEPQCRLVNYLKAGRELEWS